MKYQVITANDPDSLASSVEEWLAKGWTLHGGVAVASCVEPGYSYENHKGNQWTEAKYDYSFAQAIVLVDKPVTDAPSVETLGQWKTRHEGKYIGLDGIPDDTLIIGGVLQTPRLPPPKIPPQPGPVK